MVRIPSPPRSILITGATRGIGAALAREFAAEGVFLALTGRDPHRLAEVAADCRAAGAEVDVRPIDILDRASLADWIAGVDDDHPLDLVIANAGISAGTSRSAEEFGKVREIFATNVDGVINTLIPVVPRMRARGRGQVAIVSSIAGFRGIPGTAAYCASKAAVKVYGEGLRGQLWEDGVAINVVCPGYVVSDMTAVNQFPMPFLMPADRAARIIRRGLARNKARIVFPWPMHFAVWLMSTLPPAWTDAIMRRLPRNP